MKNIQEIIILLKPIFFQLLYMSVISSLVGGIILIIRNLFKKIIAPKWISRMWLVFIFTLIIPISIKSEISIYNIIPINIEKIRSENYLVEKINNEYEMNQEEMLSNNFQDGRKNNISVKVIDVIVILWLILMIALFFIFILTYILLQLKIKKVSNKQNEIIENKNLYQILQNCRDKLRINKNIKIIIQDYIKMPSLFGIFNIKILLNDNIENLTDQEAQYVIMHELCHYKRKDNILNLFCSFLKCVYFFNPIIIILIEQLKNDIEISTDELALYLENNENKKKYCKTLVKVSSIEVDKFVVRAICLSDNKKSLERRIDMVKILDKFKKNKKLSIISFFVILGLVIIFCTRGTNYMSRNDIINLIEKGNKINNLYMDIYYTTSTINNEDEKSETQYSIGKGYKKDNIFVEIMNNSQNEMESIVWENLNTNEQIFIDNLNKEYSLNNVDSLSSPNEKFLGLFYENSLYEYKYIGKEELEGRKTYKVELYKNYYESSTEEKITCFIDKNTGLILQVEMYGRNDVSDSISSIFKYSYKNNVVTNEDIEKPDISNYKELVK